VSTRSGLQPAIVVTEAGLYTLIMISRRPEASMVDRQVLPSALPAGPEVEREAGGGLPNEHPCPSKGQASPAFRRAWPYGPFHRSSKSVPLEWVLTFGTDDCYLHRP
jgi:hypothetical protein